jgi:hypothetical protein
MVGLGGWTALSPPGNWTGIGLRRRAQVAPSAPGTVEAPFQTINRGLEALTGGGDVLAIPIGVRGLHELDHDDPPGSAG